MSTTQPEERPTCRDCRKPLRRWQWCGHPDIDPKGARKWGYQGNGYFCALRCGYRFAITKVSP